MVLEKIQFTDILLSIFYSIFVILIAYFIRKGHKKNEAYTFLLPFVVFKIVCAVLFVLIHIYIYRGGDTFMFFAGGKFIAQYLLDHPEEFFQLFRFEISDFQSFTYRNDYNIISSFQDPSTLFICQIIAIFCFISFNSFLTATILFSVASVIGIWLLYISICKFYPQMYKVLAICILFIPTVGIWGSGILKDPVTLSILGILFYALIGILNVKKPLYYIVVIIISIYFCLKLKPYLLYTYIPAMFLWLHIVLSRRVKSKMFRFIFIPVLLIVFILGGYFFLTGISSEAGKYSLSNLENIAKGFHSWHTYLAETRDQSGYTLGEFEFTPMGIVSQIPEAIFVTFYRPLPHEVRNFATLVGSLESSILLLISIYVVIKTGIMHIFRTIFRNPEVQFFLIFSLSLGIAIGLTSYNFGALSRYKIPCMPFFTAALAIIYHLKKNPSFRLSTD